MALDRKTLRKTLRSWHQSKALGESPFAGMRQVEVRRRISGYGDTLVGYGISLREVLQDAIEAIKPGEEDPDPLKKPWRHYQILTGQYLQGRSADFLASEMGIARNTYNHEQAAALDRLLSLLDEWEVDMESEAFDAFDPIRIAAPFMAPPKAPHGLVGREILLVRLEQGLSNHGRAALHGLPGVGKTALAIEVSHRMKEQFQEGILWISLGPSPDLPVLFHLWEAATGLRSAEVQEPLDQKARASHLHAFIGDRRMLLVVDDVWDEAAARAFEIGGGNCKYIFTTRSPKLAAALAGEYSFAVPELEEGDGLMLLERFVPRRKQKGRDRWRRLVAAVGGLPQALVIAGGALRAAAYADQPRRLSEFLERLSDPSERLSLERARSALDQQAGIPSDEPITLQAVIALSDEALPSRTRAAFRRLSLLPPKPSTFGEDAAIAVSAGSVLELDQLTDAGLMESVGDQRYTIHRTISDFSRTREDFDAPVEPMITHFVDLVERHGGGFSRIDAELQNILAALRLADEKRLKSAYLSGANALYPYLEANGLLHEAERLLQRAIESTPDHPQTLLNAGRASLRLGNPERALGLFSVASYAEDASVATAALLGKGAAEYAAGNYDPAEVHYSQGLALARKHGLRQREAALLTNAGILAASRGDAEKAESDFNEALGLARAEGDRTLLGSILTNLGVIAAQNHQFKLASDCFAEAVEMARSDGNRRVMAYLHTNMGALAHDQGNHDLATEEFERALQLSRELGDKQRMSHVLASLTALAIAERQFDDAHQYVREGLRHARDAMQSDTEVLLLINQAELNRELGDLVAERSLLHEARAIAKSIGHKRYQETISHRLELNAESS